MALVEVCIPSSSVEQMGAFVLKGTAQPFEDLNVMGRENGRKMASTWFGGFAEERKIFNYVDIHFFASATGVHRKEKI